MNANPFQNFITNLKDAGKLLDIWEKIICKLSSPNLIHNSKIKIMMDSHKEKEFQCYRVQHNNSRWPYKWWIRFHQDADIDEVKALASSMSIKTAVVNIPLWWAKWWIQCNPKELSKKEIEALSRAWVQKMHEHIWQDIDIPAPDVYTNPKIMAIMMDEYEKINNKSEPWVFTWKPIELWWSLWRNKATAQWWVYVLEEYIKNKWLDKLKLKVAIQGFWNAGYHAARILHWLWFKIVAVSDSSWWIYSKKWIDPQEVYKIKCEKWKVCDSMKLHKGEAKTITNKSLLECDCDILIPAALDNQITEENVKKIKASIILELANGPTTPKADKILFKKWTIVLPDVLCNAWWVTVSYFEWVQNRMQYYWGESEIEEKLKLIMIDAFNTIWSMAENKKISLRKAAFLVAIERIAKAEKLRGI